MSDGFADLGLREELVTALAALGYEEPTPVQRETIPPLLAGRDLVGQAATGTGKTAAFALPILERLADGPRGKRPRALVLAPTRELAVQVSEATHKYGRGLGARVLPVYGGQPIFRQLRALEAGVDVVVATPGRALDHLSRGTLSLTDLQTVVLDEADEMLDMGFAEDIEAILSAAPAERQTVLFSATLPPRIAGIVRAHLRDPVRVEVVREAVPAGEAPRVRQTAYVVPRAYKPAALGRVLDVEAPTAAIVFCRSRHEVDTLTETLNGRGYRAEALHGGMSQDQREKVLGRLRAGTADLVVATDVAARGLDIDNLTHVVNYDVPSAPEAYVHRIGRVGRAGREGVALTLAEPRESRMLRTIERLTGQRIVVEKLPTVADLRARRLALTRAAVEEALLDDDLERFRVVVDALSQEHELMDVALAAVKLAHLATRTGDDGDEEDIPEQAPPREPRPPRESGGTRDAGEAAPAGWGPRSGRGVAGKHRDPGERPARPYGDPGERPARPYGAPAERPQRPYGDPGDGPPRRPRRDASVGTTRLFVGLGRAAGVRPQDLVGAIANESPVQGRDIGAIEITDRFSLVDVPEADADAVIEALRGTMIRGRKVTVRRERF